MTLSTSLAQQIEALDNLNTTVQNAASTIRAASDAINPKLIKTAANTLSNIITTNVTGGLDEDCPVGKALIQCIEKMEDGIPGAFTLAISHFKNDTVGNNHYKCTFTLTPDDETAMTLMIPVMIYRDEAEAELSERSTMQLPDGVTDIDDELRNALIDVVFEVSIHGQWLPEPSDQKALADAADTLDKAAPLLDKSLELNAA